MLYTLVVYDYIKIILKLEYAEIHGDFPVSMAVGLII